MLSLPKNSDNHHEFDKADTLEEDENPLDLLRFNSQGTMFVPNITKAKEISIALEKEKSHPRYYMTNIVKSLPFLVSFQKKNGYKVEREIKLSPVKHFNQRILNHTQIFTSGLDHIFLYYL